MSLHRTVFVGAAAALVTVGLGNAGRAENTGFVARKGMHFQLNGQPYYFVGANFWQGMNLAVDGASGDRERLGRELDRLQAAGVTNLRIMASSEGPDNQPYRMVPSLQTEPGVYNQAVFRGLDYLLGQLNSRNMRAVMVLNNFWHWSGGMAQYVQWDRGGTIPYPGNWNTFQNYSAQFYGDADCQTLYQNHISAVVNRVNTVTGKTYKNDPTIFSWELANEPRRYPAAWIDTTAAYIKSLDTNHMVTTGSEGHAGAEDYLSGWQDRDFIPTHDGPNIDYATCHIWPQNWGWYDPKNPTSGSKTYNQAETKSKTYLQNHLNDCQNTLVKPLVLEEFGLARDYASPNWNIYDPASPTTYRDAFYTAMFGEILASADAGGPGAGDNFWAWGGEGRPADPAPQWIGDPPHETPGWYSVYDRDSSTIGVISAHADAMDALVPEPGTLALAAAAAAALVFYSAWRRRSRGR